MISPRHARGDPETKLVGAARVSHPFSFAPPPFQSRLVTCRLERAAGSYFCIVRVANSRAVTSRVSSKWGRVSVQVALDMTVGASLVNSGYFAVHTAVLAALTGTLFPLPELGASIVDKVCFFYAW